MSSLKIEKQLIFGILSILVFVSCIKEKDLYKGNNPGEDYISYLYPFGSEAENVTAEITIRLNKETGTDQIKTEIPHLKYNKSWLFLLTQDDCMQAAYSTTWAAINGKPLSSIYYYDAAQLSENDLPPDVFRLNKTLGCTDGTGNEIRFHFTTTVSPELDWMNAKTEVRKGYTKDYNRFLMKKGLVWDNVKEIINYGNGIAFHDVNANNTKDAGEISQHFSIAQNMILNKLSGRGCKMLAEPNGNKTYIDAARSYAPIQTLTAQSGAISLQPFKVTTDLHKTVINRSFYTDNEGFKKEIEKQLQLDKETRPAIYDGVHGTGTSFAYFLLWLNDTYGKDGDDSVWFPSQEEYYEYNYYRNHATFKTDQLDQRTIKLTINLPGNQYFYFPSITLNVKGISMEQIASVASNNVVNGLSYGTFEEGVMLNIDCRKFLVENAAHYVEQYNRDRTNLSNKADAVYFINMIKNSPKKEELLNQVNK